MTSIAKIYTNEVYNNLRPLFANWEPNQELKLGDYGVLQDDAFIYIGTLNDLGFDIGSYGHRSRSGKDYIYFCTEGAVKVNISSSPGTSPVHATLQITFSLKDSPESVFSTRV